MPSTEYFGYTVTNVGPLTTTFTAPSSCATTTDFYVLAPEGDWSTARYGRPECDFPSLGTCFASGAAGDEIAKSASESLGQGYIPYFSPGLHCPSGWTTAGVAARTGDESNFSREGFFTKDTNPFDGDAMVDAAFLPVAMVFTEVLEPSETLVWCCPTGHIANIYGVCVSSVGPLSSFSYTDACRVLLPQENLRTFTSFQGSAWDPPLLSVTAEETQLSTEKLKLESFSDVIVVHSVPVAALVHQPTDTSESGGDEEDSGDNGGDDGDAASTIRAMTFLPMAAVLVGLLAGVGVLLPW